MADPEFFILKQWAWMNASSSDRVLGSFVQNYADPLGDSCIPDAEKSHLQYSVGELKGGPFTDFVASTYASKKDEASITLKSLAGVSFTGETSEAINLQGKLIQFRRLTGVPDFFDRVKKDPDVASRVPKWINHVRNRGAFVIVGIIICEDVEVEWTATDRKDAQGMVEAPVGQITLAAGVPNPLGDPQVKFTTREMTGHLFRAKSGESHIFGIQLRAVTKGFIIKQRQLKMSQKGPAGIAKGRLLDGITEMDDNSSNDELFLDDISFNVASDGAATAVPTGQYHSESKDAELPERSQESADAAAATSKEIKKDAINDEFSNAKEASTIPKGRDGVSPEK